MYLCLLNLNSCIFLFLISPIFPALLGHGLWTVDLALAGSLVDVFDFTNFA